MARSPALPAASKPRPPCSRSKASSRKQPELRVLVVHKPAYSYSKSLQWVTNSAHAEAAHSQLVHSSLQHAHGTRHRLTCPSGAPAARNAEASVVAASGGQVTGNGHRPTRHASLCLAAQRGDKKER